MLCTVMYVALPLLALSSDVALSSNAANNTENREIYQYLSQNGFKEVFVA